MIMCLRKFKTMCLVGQILQLNSVKKQVIAMLSGYVEKGQFKQPFSCVEMMGLIGAGNNPMVGITEALSSCS